MHLASGLEIENPGELLLGFVRRWYAMYDGVPVEQDSQLRVIEIALSTMLNSRISGNTGALIREKRQPVEAALANIPTGIGLIDVPPGEDIPGAAAISQAITTLCRVKRAKLAVSTKILHKKRPGLIYIFDRFVKEYYSPLCPSVRGRTWGDYALALTRLVHEDVLSVADELRDLADELAANGTPMTPSRILNALTWAERSDNAHYYREAAREGG